eukprot:TRINITY_DN16341_c2_g3_i1.p1 TRINITY_DN16341_c2_g3~~TRINITY_DN16341_c2_g3_i1.p1  ORF type:complete len:591 (+),score=82.67 TRINITY_DN16341_c2_g3_i1:90-1775(+)
MAEPDWSFDGLEEESDAEWLRRMLGSPAPPPVQLGGDEGTAGSAPPPPVPAPPRRPGTPCPAARAGPAPAVQRRSLNIFAFNLAAPAPPAPPPCSAAPGDAGINASGTGARAAPQPAAAAPAAVCGLCGIGGALDESTLGGYYCQRCWAAYEGPGRKVPRRCGLCDGPPPLAESTGGGFYCGGCWATYPGPCTPVRGQAPPVPPAPPPEPPQVWGVAWMASQVGATYGPGTLEPLLCKRRCMVCAHCRQWVGAVPTIETFSWLRGRRISCPYVRPAPGHPRADHLVLPAKPAPSTRAAGPRSMQWAADSDRLGPRPPVPRVSREMTMEAMGVGEVPRVKDPTPTPPTAADTAAGPAPTVSPHIAARALAAGSLDWGGAVCRRRAPDSAAQPRPLPPLTPQTHDGGHITIRAVPSAAAQCSSHSEPSSDRMDAAGNFIWHSVGITYGEQRGRKFVEAELRSFWERAKGELRQLRRDVQRAHLQDMIKIVDDVLAAGRAGGGCPAAFHTRPPAAPPTVAPPKCPPPPDSWPPPPSYGWWVPAEVRYKRGTPLPYLLERPAWAR